METLTVWYSSCLIHQSLSGSSCCCCVAAQSWQYLQFEAFVTTEYRLLRFVIHNHHSAAEYMYMLWQLIRHSKEQQPFSTSSNRAALHRLCVALLLTVFFIYILYTHRYTHTHMQGNIFKQSKMCAHTCRDKYKHSHTHWSPTVVRLCQHSDIWQGCCFTQTALSTFTVRMFLCARMLVCVCVGGWVGGCMPGYFLQTSGV